MRTENAEQVRKWDGRERQTGKNVRKGDWNRCLHVQGHTCACM